MDVGTVIRVDYAKDNLGRHYWREHDKLTLQGPFPTHEAAQRDSELKLLGPQCEVTARMQDDEIRIVDERHYQLVPADELDATAVRTYRV